MGILEALVLGIVQGIAEFLPISSSGHLAILQSLFGLSAVPLLFDVLLHLATLLVVVIVFRKRLAALIAACWRFCLRKAKPEDAENLGLVIPLLVATAITGILGFFVEKYLGNLGGKIVAAGFILTAAALVLSSRAREKKAAGKVGILDAALIGLAQGVGVLPGVSRSGATISAALGRGLERKTAGEFSFILSIPAVLGAFILSLRDADNLMANVEALPLAVAVATAFAVGLASLFLLLKVVRSGKLAWFACYLVPVGIAGIIFL